MGFPIGSAIMSAMSGIGAGSWFSNMLGKIGNFIQSPFFGTSYSIGQDLFNIYQMEKQNERTMSLQQQLWERDDNSLERLMKQYQDNGINPLLAVPNVSQGNTKGFETSAIKSQIDYEQQRMAREQYNLNKERQELELKIMENQDTRAQEEHQKSVEAKGLENSLLRARVKGAQAYAKVYGAGYGIDWGEDGYIPPYSQSFQEKLIEAGVSLIEKMLDSNGTPTFNKKQSQLPPEVSQDNDVTVPHPILQPNVCKYAGKKFEYSPETGTYFYNGKEYKLLQTVKNIIDYEKEEKSGISRENQYLGPWPDEFYEPMYLSN